MVDDNFWQKFIRPLNETLLYLPFCLKILRPLNETVPGYMSEYREIKNQVKFLILSSFPHPDTLIHKNGFFLIHRKSLFFLPYPRTHKYIWFPAAFWMNQAPYSYHVYYPANSVSLVCGGRRWWMIIFGNTL